jgi:hypothetical protein
VSAAVLEQKPCCTQVEEYLMTPSNFDTPPVGASSMASQKLIASFPTYVGAQQLVDKMSDGGFPVQHVRIVGDDLRLVEHVTGRLTNGRAALAGALSGAWFGLFIGLLFGLFADAESWFWVVLTSLLLGTLAGAVYGFVAHWATRGRRDFASIQSLEAGRYDVYVDEAHAADAARFVTAA